MGSDDYFDQRENMERRQQESKRQVQSLLCEIRRLREEIEVLRIQVSSSSPPCSRQPKSQRTNSKQNEKMSFPKDAKFISGSQEIRPKEKFPPTCQALLDESFDSTHISTKMRHDRRSQLSDTMWARLGHQTPGMEGRPCVAATQEACLGSSATMVMLEWPSRPPA